MVIAMGMETEVGEISMLLQSQDDTKAPLTRELATLTRQILWIAGVALVVSIVLNPAGVAEFTVLFAGAVAFASGHRRRSCPRWSPPSWRRPADRGALSLRREPIIMLGHNYGSEWRWGVFVMVGWTTPFASVLT